MKRMKLVFSVLAIIGVALTIVIPAKVLADEPYPTRPIQVIVPFPPGGVADLVARPFTTVLEKHLKQPVVVVNKTGAGGAVGMQAAAVSKPDGYTLMVALSSISVMPEVDALFGRPSTYKLKDFAPIALLTADPTIFVVKRKRPGRPSRIWLRTPRNDRMKSNTPPRAFTAPCTWPWKCSPMRRASRCATFPRGEEGRP